jgi:hypothetical protein
MPAEAGSTQYANGGLCLTEAHRRVGLRHKSAHSESVGCAGNLGAAFTQSTIRRPGLRSKISNLREPRGWRITNSNPIFSIKPLIFKGYHQTGGCRTPRLLALPIPRLFEGAEGFLRGI